MFSPKPWADVTPGFIRRVVLLAAVAAIATACTSGAAASPAASVDGATETASQVATASASDTPTIAATSPADTLSTQPTATTSTPASPTAAPTKAATPKPTPTQNPLAIGLCPAQQLHLKITSWQNSSDAYAHVTATNVSSATCNMRGSSRAQIVDAHGKVIADAGSSAAKVSTSDPVYSLAPNGTINTIVDWGNWCGSAPAQNVTVQMALAFGLGTIKAPAIGAAPVPSCYATTQKSSVSSEAWLP